MPRYRYTGKTTARYGSMLLEYGTEVELPSPPNRLYVLIEEPSAVPDRVMFPDPGSVKADLPPKRSGKKEE